MLRAHGASRPGSGRCTPSTTPSRVRDPRPGPRLVQPAPRRPRGGRPRLRHPDAGAGACSSTAGSGTRASRGCAVPCRTRCCWPGPSSPLTAPGSPPPSCSGPRRPGRHRRLHRTPTARRCLTRSRADAVDWDGVSALRRVLGVRPVGEVLVGTSAASAPATSCSRATARRCAGRPGPWPTRCSAGGRPAPPRRPPEPRPQRGAAASKLGGDALEAPGPAHRGSRPPRGRTPLDRELEPGAAVDGHEPHGAAGAPPLAVAAVTMSRTSRSTGSKTE